MRISNVQNCQTVKFTSLFKKVTTVPVLSIKNPTLDDLRKLEEKSKKEREKLGLVIIKEIKLQLGSKSSAK